MINNIKEKVMHSLDSFKAGNLNECAKSINEARDLFVQNYSKLPLTDIDFKTLCEMLGLKDFEFMTINYLGLIRSGHYTLDVIKK